MLILKFLQGEQAVIDEPSSKEISEYFGVVNLEILIALTLLVFLGRSIFTYLTSYYSLSYKAELSMDVRNRLVSQYVNLGYNNIKLKGQEYYINLIGEQVSRYSSGLVALIEFITFSTSFLFMIAAAFVVSGKLVSISIIALVLIFLAYRRINRLVAAASRNLTIENQNVVQAINDLVKPAKLLTVMRSFDFVSKSASLSVRKYFELEKVIAKGAALARATREPAILLIILFLICFDYYIMGGNFDNLIVTFLLFYRALGHAMSLQSVYQKKMSNLGAIELIAHELANKQRMFKPSEIGQKTDKEIMSIKLVDYDIHSNNYSIISNVNVEIFFGKTYLIKGPSGIGKSSFVDALIGVCPQHNGAFLINSLETNVPLYKLTNVAYIDQTPYIFNCSIIENVTMKLKSELGYSEIEKATGILHDLGLGVLLSSLPNGADTLVGTNGRSLSGGESQRITVARALYANAHCLVFDEATAALDENNTKGLIELINNLKEGRTIFIIAHNEYFDDVADHKIMISKTSVDVI
ncbi:ABC transporter ATP-binding protein/permease [Amylibacter sp.]|nr:ABC transporter ATP-binding protein/permease [Amylibacter sp.]